jgi:histidinol-phosphate aminotransferase
MHDAIGDATSVVYVCNPNNPTGTYRSAVDVESFIESVPSEVLVVVDEAYAEYVTAHDWGTMIPIALRQPNVIVLRTFSKIYGLAGLRIGYAVGMPGTLAGLRRAQRPFTVSQLAQAAAREALRYPGRVERRRLENERGRRLLTDGLLDRGIEAIPSQANFVYCDLGPDTGRLVEDLLRKGVIIRTYGDGWSRVSVGTEMENRRFLMALDQAM